MIMNGFIVHTTERRDGGKIGQHGRKAGFYGVCED